MVFLFVSRRAFTLSQNYPGCALRASQEWDHLCSSPQLQSSSSHGHITPGCWQSVPVPPSRPTHSSQHRSWRHPFNAPAGKHSLMHSALTWLPVSLRVTPPFFIGAYEALRYLQHPASPPLCWMPCSSFLPHSLRPVAPLLMLKYGLDTPGLGSACFLYHTKHTVLCPPHSHFVLLLSETL